MKASLFLLFVAGLNVVFANANLGSTDIKTRPAGSRGIRGLKDEDLQTLWSFLDFVSRGPPGSPDARGPDTRRVSVAEDLQQLRSNTDLTNSETEKEASRKRAEEILKNLLQELMEE